MGVMKTITLAVALLATSCAMPASEQGRSSLGGSTGPAPAFTVTVSFAGPVNVTSSSVPTAAPAASSTADAKQDAKADGKVDLKVPAGAGGLSLSPPEKTVETKPEPEKKPGE